MSRVLIIPTILLLFFGTIAYLSSGGTPAPESDAQRPLVFVSPDDIESLDISYMSWMGDIRAAMGLWEGLAAYAPETLEPKPAVAESWDISPDRKTYTFHLRHDCKWSNGQPVTAADFLFSWKRVLTPATGAQYIELFNVIQGAEEYAKALSDRADELAKYDDIFAAPTLPDFSMVGAKAPDPYTIVVTLKAPCSYFLDLVAFQTFYPLNEESMRPFLIKQKNPYRGYDNRFTHPPNLVTNGPYKITEWKFQQYLMLEPNSYYWDRQNVHCDKLMLKAIPKDERAALLSYQTGTADVLSWLPQDSGPDLIEDFKAGKRPDLHYRPVFGTMYYVFNCARKPFDDKRVRKALSLAIDREEIAGKVTRMDQKAIGLLVPPDSIRGYKSPQELPYDVATARKLLADAGFPNGKGMPTIELLYSSDSPMYGKISQAMGQMWKRNLNVDVTYRGLERASFSDARQTTHDFDIARGGWYGDYPDPTTWLDLARSTNGNNDGAFACPEYDAILDKAALEPDPDKRLAILTQAEAMIVQDQFPFIPLFQTVDGYIFDENKIQGVDVNVRMLEQFKYIRRVQEPGSAK